MDTGGRTCRQGRELVTLFPSSAGGRGATLGCLPPSRSLGCFRSAAYSTRPKNPAPHSFVFVFRGETKRRLPSPRCGKMVLADQNLPYALPQAGEGRKVTRRIGAVRCLDRYSTYLERSVSFAMPESCLLT
jgi:hypothetical protein